MGTKWLAEFILRSLPVEEKGLITPCLCLFTRSFWIITMAGARNRVLKSTNSRGNLSTTSQSITRPSMQRYKKALTVVHFTVSLGRNVNKPLDKNDYLRKIDIVLELSANSLSVTNRTWTPAWPSQFPIFRTMDPCSLKLLCSPIRLWRCCFSTSTFTEPFGGYRIRTITMHW